MKLQEIRARMPRTATMGEIMHLTGSLIFLLMACFDKVARGGLRPFFERIAENCEATSLWRTKNHHVALIANIMVGVEFFIQVIPLIEPRVYALGTISSCRESGTQPSRRLNLSCR